MSVPLDRLYNFLHDVCNHHDLVIYRFFPHGSRKIFDLTLTQIPPPKNEYWKLRQVIFHDQEPLDYNAYSDIEVAKEYLSNTKNAPLKFNRPNMEEKLIKFYSKLNLRMAIIQPFYATKPVLLVHSEKNSKNLEQYENNLGMAGVYWWCHAVIARDWFRHAEHDTILNLRQPTTDFLIYNRAWSGTREYRLKFIELIVDNQLIAHCLTKFSPYDEEKYYQDHKFKNKDFSIITTELEKILEKNTTNSSASADYVSQDYCNTQLEVVLETLFDDDRIQLTEKSLRPIACGHPFILVSTRGSLEYLRSYGFKTFGNCINESYDLINNPLERLNAIVSEMRRIANLSTEKKQQMYAELRLIAQHNKELFFSKEWHNQIIQEYKDNFDSALKVTNKFKIDVSDLTSQS
jgi:hypothetical protein